MTYFYNFLMVQIKGKGLSRTFLYTDVIQYSAKLNQNAFQLVETEISRNG